MWFDFFSSNFFQIAEIFVGIAILAVVLAVLFGRSKVNGSSLGKKKGEVSASSSSSSLKSPSPAYVAEFEDTTKPVVPSSVDGETWVPVVMKVRKDEAQFLPKDALVVGVSAQGESAPAVPEVPKKELNKAEARWSKFRVTAS